MDEVKTAVLQDFKDECSILPVEQFTATHGKAFLLHHGPIGALQQPLGPQQTYAAEMDDIRPGLFVRPQADFIVFPVRNTERSRFSQFVTVGRVKNNDIVIADVSISKLHALFLPHQDTFAVLDAGSINGTFMNGEQVPIRGQGQAQPLTSGTQLRFGSVEMTYLLAPEFFIFVNRVL